MSLKSPTMSPTLYGESLNASLRAALAESNLPMLSHAGGYMEGAEDLSISRQMSEDMEGDEDFRDDDGDDMGASDLSIHMREESSQEMERSSEDATQQPPAQLQENSFQQLPQHQQHQHQPPISRQDNPSEMDVEAALHVKAKLGQEFPNHAAGLQHPEIRGARVDVRLDAEKHEMLTSMMSSIEHMQQHLQQQQQQAAAQQAAMQQLQQQQQQPVEIANHSDNLHSITATEK